MDSLLRDIFEFFYVFIICVFLYKVLNKDWNIIVFDFSIQTPGFPKKICSFCILLLFIYQKLSFVYLVKLF